MTARSTLYERRLRFDPRFLERKAELVGPSLRKSPRNSRATIEAHRDRIARERRQRAAAAAARRLERYLKPISFEAP